MTQPTCQFEGLAKGLARARRDGTTVVELAVVMLVFLLVLFGIMEYSRFLFVNQVVINAAREGARYAVVNTNDITLEADTLAYVDKKMSGLEKRTSYYLAQVYKADVKGTKIGAADEAGFGEYIAVQIDYDYFPVLPTLLFLDSKMRITTKSLMYSEAN